MRERSERKQNNSGNENEHENVNENETETKRNANKSEMPEGGEWNRAKHEGKPQSRRRRSRRKFFTAFCCVFQILFRFLLGTFLIYYVVFLITAEDVLAAAAAFLFISTTHTHTHPQHMHTLILWGFSVMLETCLRGKWRSTKRNACRHPFLLPPHPLALFNCVYRNKKSEENSIVCSEHTHKKKPEPLYIAHCGGVYVVYNTYTYVAFFLLSVHCAAFAFITPRRRRRATTPTLTATATTTNTLMNLHEWIFEKLLQDAQQYFHSSEKNWKGQQSKEGMWGAGMK